MIKFEKAEVWGWEHAIRGMRNPLNSWDKSDSDFAIGYADIGKNDAKLMLKLTKAGAPHRKFLRQVFVSVDITAPLYWWSEFDTYKVGTTANSCSKMHKLLYKPFETSDFSFDHLFGYKNEIAQFRPLVDESLERWETITGDYEISSQGRLRHKNRVLSCSVRKDGYIFTNIHGKQIPVHRLVATAFCVKGVNDTEVNHLDGNKMNNAADNLEWCTRSENQKHAIENHLQPKATNTYKGKFTAEQRQEIKDLWDLGECSKRELAKRYHVSHTCICDIINDKYKYVERTNVYEQVAKPMVDMLNEFRDSYFRCENIVDKKKIWYAILQLLPESYNQKRTVTMTYENLLNILEYRKNHKLDEWREFCSWIATLPYSKLLLDVIEQKEED